MKKEIHAFDAWFQKASSYAQKKVSSFPDFKCWLFGHYHDNRVIAQMFILLYEQIVELPYPRWKTSYNRVRLSYPDVWE
jgi:hypothetical protein